MNVNPHTKLRVQYTSLKLVAFVVFQSPKTAVGLPLGANEEDNIDIVGNTVGASDVKGVKVNQQSEKRPYSKTKKPRTEREREKERERERKEENSTREGIAERASEGATEGAVEANVTDGASDIEPLPSEGEGEAKTEGETVELNDDDDGETLGPSVEDQNNAGLIVGSVSISHQTQCHKHKHRHK